MESEVASSNDVAEAPALHRTTRRVSVTLKGAAYYKRASRLAGKPEDKFIHFGSRALSRSFRGRHVAARGGCLARHGERQVPGETIGTGSAGTRPTTAAHGDLPGD
jgi:hypothetical protein